MIIFKKILMASIIFSGAFNLVAADLRPVFEEKVHYKILEFNQSTNNLCCHGCRISFNRKSKKVKEYRGCLNCRMSFCGRDTCPAGLNPFSEKGCVVCEGYCCCCYDECLAEHVHCFTSKRTEKRYESEDLKWRKQRKEYSIKSEEVKTEPEERVHTQVNIKTDSIRNSQDIKIKRETGNLSKKMPKAKKQKVVCNKPVMPEHKAPLASKQREKNAEDDLPGIFTAQVCMAPELLFHPGEIFLGIPVIEKLEPEEADFNMAKKKILK